MPHIKCLAQGLRVVVMVMLFPAASTTTLPTPSHHAPPSSPVPGPLLWSIWPDLLSPLQALGSTPVCTSLNALPTTATPHMSVASGLSSQSETPSSTPMLPNFTVGKWVQRGQSPPPRHQPKTHSRLGSWMVVELRPFTVSSGKPGCGSHSALLGQGQVSTIYSKYQEYHVCQPTTHYPRTLLHWIPSPMGVMQGLGS